MSLFNSIYDYFTGYDENTDPNSYKNQKQRLESPKAQPKPSPLGGSVREFIAQDPATDRPSGSAWDKLDKPSK